MADLDICEAVYLERVLPAYRALLAGVKADLGTRIGGVPAFDRIGSRFHGLGHWVRVGCAALRIADVAVLEAAELQLGPGLTALTGETGAGKSILIEALALVLGGRASDRVIRTGKETAEIEAQFDQVATPALTALLAGIGLPDSR